MAKLIAFFTLVFLVSVGVLLPPFLKADASAPIPTDVWKPVNAVVEKLAPVPKTIQEKTVTTIANKIPSLKQKAHYFLHPKVKYPTLTASIITYGEWWGNVPKNTCISSPMGAKGLAQAMPATANARGLRNRCDEQESVIFVGKQIEAIFNELKSRHVVQCDKSRNPRFPQLTNECVLYVAGAYNAGVAGYLSGVQPEKNYHYRVLNGYNKLLERKG